MFYRLEEIWIKKVSEYISVRALSCYDYEFYVEDDATDEEIEQNVNSLVIVIMWKKVMKLIWK